MCSLELASGFDLCKESMSWGDLYLLGWRISKTILKSIMMSQKPITPNSCVCEKYCGFCAWGVEKYKTTKTEPDVFSGKLGGDISCFAPKVRHTNACVLGEPENQNPQDGCLVSGTSFARSCLSPENPERPRTCGLERHDFRLKKKHVCSLKIYCVSCLRLQKTHKANVMRSGELQIGRSSRHVCSLEVYYYY
jgi:hypothetical protein